ncbi:SubName: Full=Uncharacterized protein {ECO:0000313/EMBL:CCA74189.1} [Serendipita indica DSM 11827]|uniref:Uncharacterized protein n=1 Tax=Serendipita indica (strain DSM 11827) TaxID=1109443 RepID=G4TS96_SERID|nr:SubName: Full=Uncharacterized protein {ECO:0000313/EMBL:CCA74189.1} [Serendipita indica DSM 11827]CCA74189.1 hypothetical protein PIIN_08142 [Serendipita indica DSM 11827]
MSASQIPENLTQDKTLGWRQQLTTFTKSLDSSQGESDPPSQGKAGRSSAEKPRLRAISRPAELTKLDILDPSIPPSNPSTEATMPPIRVREGDQWDPAYWSRKQAEYRHFYLHDALEYGTTQSNVSLPPPPRPKPTKPTPKKIIIDTSVRPTPPKGPRLALPSRDKKKEIHHRQRSLSFPRAYRPPKEGAKPGTVDDQPRVVLRREPGVSARRDSPVFPTVPLPPWSPVPFPRYAEQPMPVEPEPKVRRLPKPKLSLSIPD